MEKSDAVASLGQSSLLQPTRVRAALRANDRLKLYLTVLQAAATQAAHPSQSALDLSREIAAAGVGASDEADWLHDLPATASRQGGLVHLPDLPRLARGLRDDLLTMARPLLDDATERDGFAPRVAHWARHLAAITGPALDADALTALTHGRRDGKTDSLHLTVMDLHKALNRLAARLAAETVEGAHVWQLAADGRDQPRVAAFMRGLNRTRGLKLDHPGLDTAATRDGDTLLIQNDIGTNDAHVLVLQVHADAAPPRITLTYSDLHRQRFAFFQKLLSEVGAGVGMSWGDVQQRTTAGLNDGEAYHLGTATFEAPDEAGLQQRLEDIGARIVFLIDWNRARKRLLAFVDGAGAVAVLTEAARRECGHMAWLQAGGERLVWNAMAAQGEGVFRLGDRLDDVMGSEPARSLLTELLALAWQAAQRQQPVALVADEARWLLARRMQGRLGQMELLEEHAALCHALAQGLRDGLAHGAHRDAAAAAQLAAHAKGWERQADHLVMRARALAERQPQWQPVARLLERSDDVADALEEAAFVVSMVADGHHQGWGGAVLAELQALAGAVLTATQDHVKALAVVRTLGGLAEGGGEGGGDAADRDEFLAASWRVLQAERQCDTLLRSARRTLAREVSDSASLLLGNELAAALEQASDALLALVYGLRERAFQRAGVSA